MTAWFQLVTPTYLVTRLPFCTIFMRTHINIHKQLLGVKINSFSNYRVQTNHTCSSFFLISQIIAYFRNIKKSFWRILYYHITIKFNFILLHVNDKNQFYYSLFSSFISEWTCLDFRFTPWKDRQNIFHNYSRWWWCPPPFSKTNLVKPFSRIMKLSFEIFIV